MSKVQQKDIERLIKLLGGADNFVTLTHCITRLRFVLQDPALADAKGIETLPMVKGCFITAGQFQVVIGTEWICPLYFQAISAHGQNQSRQRECASVSTQ